MPGKDLSYDKSFGSYTITEFRVSEMNLTLIKLTAIEIYSVQPIITAFAPETEVSLKGLHTGLFIK